MKQDYELMLVLNPALSQEDNAEAREQVRELITSNGGEITTEDEWGTRRLAYSIKKAGQTYLEGIYYLFRFNLEPATVGEIDRPLRLSERVLRHMVVKSSVPKEAPTAAVETKEPDANEAEEAQEPETAETVEAVETKE
ncbi:MAG: 30S ribosomal protein S6 [Chloroflexi bacterium]|nr:30S ribosomal protein S6 [Chloroflexota bacterium]MCZ6867479.1 30S ribosomal protein S6 [Chloroflexota bacterium]